MDATTLIALGLAVWAALELRRSFVRALLAGALALVVYSPTLAERALMALAGLGAGDLGGALLLLILAGIGVWLMLGRLGRGRRAGR